MHSNLSRLKDIAKELPGFEIPSSLVDKQQWAPQYTKLNMSKKSECIHRLCKTNEWQTKNVLMYQRCPKITISVHYRYLLTSIYMNPFLWKLIACKGHGLFEDQKTPTVLHLQLEYCVILSVCFSTYTAMITY